MSQTHSSPLVQQVQDAQAGAVAEALVDLGQFHRGGSRRSILYTLKGIYLDGYISSEIARIPAGLPVYRPRGRRRWPAIVT